MKIIILVAMAIVLHTAVKAQSGPEILIDPNSTACGGDLEIKIFTQSLPSQTPNGETQWMALPGTDTRYDYTSLNWVTDPGAFVSMSNEWDFYRVEVRNCNTPSAGATGPMCSSGNLDGLVLDNYIAVVGCFMYSSSCGSCSSGQEISVSAGFGQNAQVVFHDF